MLHVLIYIVVLLTFSTAYADENTEIQKTFDNITKHIKKTDKKPQHLDVIERKSDKFNIRVMNSSDKNFDINSTLQKAKDFFKSGDSESAISLLNQIITKFPNHKNTLIGLGNIYYLNHDYDKAVKIYIKLLEEYPNNPYILETFLIIISQYDSDLALSEMLKLYETHKNYAPLLANLGLIYMQKNDLIKAKEYLMRAYSINQNNIFYVYNLAVILDNLSDLKNATVFYEKLLSMLATAKSVNKKLPVDKITARLRFIANTRA